MGGVRRFQNEDGSLTAAGKSRYYNTDGSLTKRGQRQYKKEYKKLNKLRENADLATQSMNLNKYDTRARAGLGWTIALGGAAAANATGGKDRAIASYMAKALKNRTSYANDYQRRAKNLFDDYSSNFENFARIKQSTNNLTAQYNKNMDSLKKEMNDLINADNKRASNQTIGLNSVMTKVLAGTTAVAAGYTAYNALKAHAASVRMTEAGHSKAVAKYEAQINKIKSTFGDIKMSDLEKKNKKK